MSLTLIFVMGEVNSLKPHCVVLVDAVPPDGPGGALVEPGG